MKISPQFVYLVPANRTRIPFTMDGGYWQRSIEQAMWHE